MPKKVALHASITADRVMEAVERDDNVGFCKACGEEADGCEPDARNYKCEACGEKRVFGASELLFEFEF